MSEKPKLTEADVLRIREAHRTGAAVDQIAAAFGVSPETVRVIVERPSWGHAS